MKLCYADLILKSAQVLCLLVNSVSLQMSPTFKAAQMSEQAKTSSHNYISVGKLLQTGANFPLTSGFRDQYTRIPGTSLLEPI